MKPLGRRLLCRPVEVESNYPGSRIVLLPDRVALEVKQQAEIVAVGPGEWDADLAEFIPTDPRLQPGTWILHADFMRVTVGDGDLFFLHERDVVAILEVA
jgi:co-chaperonin GroES (HSP10)